MVPIDPAIALTGEDTAIASCGVTVVVVVAAFVAGAAWSVGSDRVADVVWAPEVEEKETDGLITPRAVPATMGVVVVDVQVRFVLAPESTQVHPTGVGAEANVPPLGAVSVTTGSA